MPDNTAGDSMPQNPEPAVAPQAATPSGRPWPDRANCAGEDPGLFFPLHGDPAIRARRICGKCPVRADCLEYATGADEWGIWGGLDREQRRALRDAATNPQSPRQHSTAREENRQSA